MKRTDRVCVVGETHLRCNITRRVYVNEKGERFIRDKRGENGYLCIENLPCGKMTYRD